MNTYNTCETEQIGHNNISKYILLQNKIIELPTNKTKKFKENNTIGIKIYENIGYTLGRMDPNHISNTPPNHFMDILKKRIDVYYSSPDTISSGVSSGGKSILL